jgi:hypothetical protein
MASDFDPTSFPQCGIHPMAAIPDPTTGFATAHVPRRRAGSTTDHSRIPGNVPQIKGHLVKDARCGCIVRPGVFRSDRSSARCWNRLNPLDDFWIDPWNSRSAKV